MNFGSKRRAPFDARIEIAPLIDVVFLLLIFFLLTTSFVQHRTLGVELPTTRGAPTEAPEDAIVLVLPKEGPILLGGRALDGTALERVLVAAAKREPPPPVILQADEAVPHGKVVALLDKVRTAGLRHLAIATRTATRVGAAPSPPAPAPAPPERAP